MAPTAKKPVKKAAKAAAISRTVKFEVLGGKVLSRKVINGTPLSEAAHAAGLDTFDFFFNRKKVDPASVIKKDMVYTAMPNSKNG